ncbi:6-bladed beta-propeller [Geofilum rubicundum]|uniref:6-bladed beta-propeller n=1 Tax=Geofilum rubicundum TaxID=472113 RepID=UPI0007850CBF|nr:6-bladed beta-propeller [Geofilum rubicundum]
MRTPFFRFHSFAKAKFSFCPFIAAPQTFKAIPNNLNLTFLVMAVLFLASCNRTTQDSKTLSPDIVTIDVKESDFIVNGKLSDVISIDSLVFLEYTDESIIGEIDKVLVSEDRIYVVDRHSAKSIFCFDRKGNFINSYNAIGRGPQEYLEIFDTSFFRDKMYVFAAPNQFFVLDENLKFEKSIDINWTVDIPLDPDYPYFSVINSETILFCHPSAHYHYHLYNLSKQAFISSHIKRLGTLDVSSQRNLTKNTSGKMFLSRFYNDTIYTVSENLMTPEYIINFEKPMTDNEIEERLKLNAYNSFNHPRPQKMYNVSSFIYNEEYISFEFEFKRSGHFCFYNPEKNIMKIFNNSLENDLFQGTYLRSSIGHHQNSNITWLEVTGLVDNKEEISFSIPDDLSYDSNPALVFYRPKFE